jgi:hypothetical protein
VTKSVVSFNFHKTNSHNFVDYRAIKNSQPHQRFFVEATPTRFPKKPEFISLTNPTEVDPHLILMILQELGRHNVPLFTQSCQIKNELSTLNLDNDSKMNLISQELVQHLQLPPTPHSHTYHLGRVQKGGPQITITHSCTITFTIGHSHVNVIWDMSPLDCVDLLLGLPYKQNKKRCITPRLILTTLNMLGAPMYLLHILSLHHCHEPIA